MGMKYNVSYHNAIIKPASYAALMGWTAEQAAAEPEKLAQLALEHVTDLVDAFACEPTQDPETGIDLDGCGYWDGAGYGYGEHLRELLSYCEPGAYIHEVDEEEASGDQWRFLVMPDRTVETIQPVITWPGMENAA